MKQRIRYVLAQLVARFILLFFSRGVRRRALKGEFILSIYFHDPSKELFQFCVSWLVRNGFRVLSEREMLKVFNNEIEFPKGCVVITVDDGWKGNEENIVAVANAYRIPVTIFVSCEPVEKGNYWWSYIPHANSDMEQHWDVERLKRIPNGERNNICSGIKKRVLLSRDALTIGQVKQISERDGITIGSHTVTHPILPMCTDKESQEEIFTSKKVIERWIKKPVVSFAYPNGDYGEREIQYLKDAGYRMAFTTNPKYVRRQEINRIYEVPRFEVIENISKSEAVCRMLGLWQRFI